MLTLLAFWIPDPGERDRLVRHAEEAAQRAETRLAAVGEAEGVREAVLAHIEANLREKAERPDGPFPLTAEDIERRVVDWEAFRAEAFVTSGVFPKRYFGYVDGKGDTAAEEARVHRAVAASVDAGNAWLDDQGVEWRITDAEVLTTWLSEGGALWLQGGEIPVPARFHPVFDVGLDDLASGAADLADLRRRLDQSAGTELDGMVALWDGKSPQLPVATEVPQGERWLQHANGEAGPFPYLVRYMTLEESVTGTTLMYVWEKQIAERKLREERLDGLAGRPLDEQFVIASLVYNSGRLHAPSTWEQIRTFRAAERLWRTSEDNAHRRPRLPVVPAADGLALLRAGKPYPEQPTSWVGVYHVLQRFGGFSGLTSFTDVFRDGHYSTRQP